MALTRDQIRAAADLTTELVATPAWRDPETGEDETRIQELDANARQAYGEMFLELRDDLEDGVTRLPKSYYATVAAMGIVDDAGTLQYDHRNADDVAELAGKGRTTILVAKRILAISGLDTESAEDAEGKSAETPSD